MVKEPLKTFLLRMFAVILLCVDSLLFPIYGDICTKNDYTGQENCTAYHLLFVGLWHVFEFLDKYNAVFTTLATVIIAYFTYSLRNVTTGQLTQLTKEFEATHRPQLICRKAFVIGPEDGKPITVYYVLANIGDSHATLIEAKAEILVVSYNERRLNFVMAHSPVSVALDEPFEPGESRKFVHADERRWKQEVIAGGRGEDCYFQCYFRYRDGRGVIREMAFSRKYDPMYFRFRRSDDPEIDYAD